MTLDDNEQGNVNPLSPVYLPEFGHCVSWAMCRNPACKNFGIHYQGRAPVGRETVSDDRYQFNASTGQFICDYCAMSFTLRSNQAIRPFARYYLKLSLPFADCANQQCKNHGVNVFEHITPWKKPKDRLYSSDGEYKMLCRLCKRRFQIGKALRLTPDRDTRKHIRNIVDGVITTRTVLNSVDVTYKSPDTYYKRLFNLASRLREYQAWRNVHLWHQKFADVDTPVRVFTDILQVPLKRLGGAGRFHNINVMMSVVAIKKTYYVLAAHVDFLPDEYEYCPDDAALFEDYNRPKFGQAWNCLQHMFRRGDSESVMDAVKGVPDVGRDGYFGESHYPDLAHFLVVRKMLSRFRKVHYFMDCSERLYSAALAALAPDIKDQQAEIVLFQHRKDPADAAIEEMEERDEDGDNEDYEADKEIKLDSAWENMCAEFKKRVTVDDIIPDSPEICRQRVAREFKSAINGAYSDSGWAWLKFPSTNKLYTDPRTLWLTWTPDKTYETQGREMLSRATLQPIDSACNLMRTRISGFDRPDFRAQPGRSYRSSYFLPQVLCAEMWIVLLWRNYGARYSSPKKLPPATFMGLTRPKETKDISDTSNKKDPKVYKHLKELIMFRPIWDFRLGTTQAKRISKWLR